MAINYKSASCWLLCLSLMGGCVSIKLDSPKAAAKKSEEAFKKIQELALGNGSDVQKNDVAYLRLLTRFTPAPENPNELPLKKNDCNDFNGRYSNRDYEAILFASVISDYEGDSQNILNGIPIVSYHQAKKCKFFTLQEKYISQYIKLDSDNLIASLSLGYSEREKISPNLDQMLNDAGKVSSALSAAGLAAAAPIRKILTAQDTKDAVSNINTYISESEPVSITDSSGGSYLIAEIAGDIKVNAIDIVLQHILTKTFEKPVPYPLGTFHILPIIQSTLLFDTNNRGIPIIGNNDEYTKLLNSSNNKLTNGKPLWSTLVGDRLETVNLIKFEPKKDSNEYQKFHTACRTLDDLTKKIGLNIYDRAGLLYLLLSDFQLPESNQNWREFNESISDKTPIRDLEKYRANNFDKCLNDAYYLALKKMLPEQTISKKEISELIVRKKADENKASKNQIIKTAKNFIKLVADSANPQFIPKHLKNLIPKDGWSLIYDNNNLFEDKEFLQKLGWTDLDQGEDEVNRKLRSFPFDDVALAKLLISIPMKIDSECFILSDDPSDPSKANGIRYPFTTSGRTEPGVLELSMDSTGTKLSGIAFNNMSQDFKDQISEKPICASSTEKSAEL